MREKESGERVMKRSYMAIKSIFNILNFKYNIFILTAYLSF